MYRLGINFDEISDSLKTALTVMRDVNVKFGEIRTVNNVNFVYWDKDEIYTIKSLVAEAGITLIAAASPMFKWYENPDDEEIKHDSFGFNPRLDVSEKKLVIKNTIENANQLDIKKIRIFSGLGRYEVDKSDFYTNNLLHYALSVAEKYDIDLLIENEPVCKTHNKKQLVDLFSNIDHPNLKLWLDIANLYEVDEAVDSAFLKNIIHKTEYIHVKDFVRENDKLVYVPAGNGEIPYVDIFKDIYSLKSNNIVVTVETHAKNNKKQLSIESIIGTREILDKAGVHYE